MLIRQRFTLTVAVIFSFLWISSTLAASETRGIRIKLRTKESPGAPVAEEVNLYGSSYALVIGIDNYNQGWPRLSNAVRDAKLVAEELRRKGFEVTLKTNLKSKELEQVFKEFFIIKGDNTPARLFVWFAGHGHTLNGEGFLVPADAPRTDKGAQFRLKALSMRRFGEYVRLAQSKHVFAVFDSCFSGTIFTTQRSSPPIAVTRATTLPVRQFLSSGDAHQQVSDDGMFRKLFVRAIRGEERADANGDGYLTGSELGLFLTDRMINLTRSAQSPRYGKLRDPDYDRGDFVFLLTSSGAVIEKPTSKPSEAFPLELNDYIGKGIRVEAAQKIIELREVLKENSDNIEAWINLGNIYFDNDLHLEAIEAYETSLQLNPKDANVWTDLGSMYQRNGQSEEAIKALNKAIEVDSRHEIALYNKGIVLYHDLNDRKGAIKTWRNLVRINPSFKAPNGTLIKDIINRIQ